MENLIDLVRRRSILNDDENILGVPKYVEHLPRAEKIIPGHTLLKPSFDLGIPMRELDIQVLEKQRMLSNNPLVNNQRRSRKIKSAYRIRQSSESTDSSDLSPSSASSDYEKNAGNPFTIHKDKYKQNWLWYHEMDGDHMNVNPYAPTFQNYGPSGSSLFFGRKWWYFNQVSYIYIKLL
ncbi:uncharacterized protein LOC123689512 [Pieris rapae]|uniref:uncharacterized protein LOC123689512 n=1 Tax=Pieris rapae TaxID=64459 RepID=UPI001E27ED7C|nr:uncharacterized protein LOC123689512 [Pieris rapae]